MLDSFIKTSATGGLGSIKAEVMADTAVALASGNVKLVSSKVITFPLPSGLWRDLFLFGGFVGFFAISHFKVKLKFFCDKTFFSPHIF